MTFFTIDHRYGYICLYELDVICMTGKSLLRLQGCDWLRWRIGLGVNGVMTFMKEFITIQYWSWPSLTLSPPLLSLVILVLGIEMVCIMFFLFFFMSSMGFCWIVLGYYANFRFCWYRNLRPLYESFYVWYLMSLLKELLGLQF